MNQSEVNNMFKMVKKAIDVPLMDVYNISTLIMDFTVCPNKHFEFNYGYRLYDGIPHYIYAIVLAENKEEAFTLLKCKLDTLKVESSYNEELTYSSLRLEDFRVNTLYNEEYVVLSETRLEYLSISQRDWDGGSSFCSLLNLDYIVYEYKYRSKLNKQYVKKFRNIFNFIYYHKHNSTDRNELVEEAQNSIQYLF
jgi:hypothetical protein